MVFFKKRKDIISVWDERFPYFKPEEVLGKSGYKLFLDRGEIMINEVALGKLCDFRRAIGEKIIVNSGYRSHEENAKVGGTKFSFHCLGLAFDIRSKGVDLEVLYREAKNFGWRGIGRYDTFLHIDWRPILDGNIREWDFRTRK